MVSQPIHGGSGNLVMLRQRLSLEENSGQENAGMTSVIPDLTGSADSERQGQAPEDNLQSPEVATIISEIRAAYANGHPAREDVKEMLASQLEVRWQTIREHDQGWRERSRNQNAPWMSTSECAKTFQESDSSEIDRLRTVLGERNYLEFRRDEQFLALHQWLDDLVGYASTCPARAEETVLKRHRLFRNLLDKMINGVVCNEG